MRLLRLLLVLLAVYVPNQRHFPQDLGLKGLNVFNLLLLVTLLVMLATGAGAGRPAPLKGRILIFCGLLLVSFLIGQAHPAAELLDDLTALKTALSYVVLYFIFFHGSDDHETTRWLILAVLGVVFLASLETIRQGLEHGFGAYRLSHRVSGPFGADWQNANRAGVFFAAFAPLFLATALFYRSRPLLAAAGALATLTSTLAVFFTYSRQAYIILAVGAVCLVALRRSVVLGLLVLALAGGYASWAPSGVVERMEMTYEKDAHGQEELEESAESRLVIWQGAWEIFKEHPLGIGFRRFTDEIGKHTPYRDKDAHSQYVLIGTEDGLQGLAAFLAVLVGLFGLGWRLSRVALDDESRTLGYGYAVAVVCLALGNVYGSPFFFGEVIGDFWALSALVARYTLDLEDVEGAQAVEAEAQGVTRAAVGDDDRGPVDDDSSHHP